MRNTWVSWGVLALAGLPACSASINDPSGYDGSGGTATSGGATASGGSGPAAGGMTVFGGSGGSGPSASGGPGASGSTSLGGSTFGGVGNGGSTLGGASSGGASSGGVGTSGATSTTGGAVATTGGQAGKGGAASGGASTSGGRQGKGGAESGGSAGAATSGGATATGGTTATGGSGGSATGEGCSKFQSGGTGKEAGGQIPLCCAPTATEKTSIDEVFRLLNEHRAANGLSALAYDTLLESAIHGHCMHMAVHTFFAHEAPETSITLPWDRAELCGTSANGENIAQGQRTPADVMTAWKNSSGHNMNMLGNFKRVGVGFEDSGRYWGQIFGR